MAHFSALICCANSGDTLQAACESVQWADELVIVDSGSSDNTAEIARRYADKYVLEPWRGYTEQKKFGTTLCQNDWVFSLVGDEECSEELAAQIGTLTDRDFERLDVVFVKRRNFVMGRHVRAWDPDWQSRLIHRHRCRWADAALHDARLPSHPSRGRRLKGWIYHKRVGQQSFSDYFSGARSDSRLSMLAEEMYRKEKRCRWTHLVLRPIWAFVKFYLIKRGFRDGMFGLLIAQKAAVGVQLKYAALWAYQQAAESVDSEGGRASAKQDASANRTATGNAKDKATSRAA